MRGGSERARRRRHRRSGEPLELWRTCVAGESEASTQRNNTEKIIEKMEGVGGSMAELGAAPTVASGDVDALGALSGGRFPPRSRL